MILLPILYTGVLVLVAADNESLVLRSIMIRHERDRVVKDLEQRNADVRDAMARAEQSAQARARVLAAASHDLRQPLPRCRSTARFWRQIRPRKRCGK